MKTSTVVAVGLGVLVVLGLSVVTLGVGGLGKGTVTLSLAMSSGVCQPSDPDRIGGWKGRKVTWEITNVDCPPQYVSFRNFRHPLGGGTYDPPENVLDPPLVQAGPVATGATVSQAAKIDKGEFFKIFKYDIWTGDTAAGQVIRRDPDIDIWP